ncbi:MAG: hypothetical protein EZS28_037849 [Streblomastix strix]|uniref:Uncharacterized protein n=1 Tax=Streblomastix strix TaxID=222440 RepID=A0A5J4UAD9_9EUKA|nr:MAG: hypothetical protein EZS28_037849 [Streblomastix strix]
MWLSCISSSSTASPNTRSSSRCHFLAHWHMDEFVVDIPLRFASPLGPDLCVRLLQDAVKSIIFLRQQIPMSFDELLRNVDNIETKPNPRQKRAQKFAIATSRLLQSVEDLFFVNISGVRVPRRVICASICLGQGLCCLNERFTFVFASSNDESGNAGTTSEILRRSALQLIQKASSIKNKPIIENVPCGIGSRRTTRNFDNFTFPKTFFIL